MLSLLAVTVGGCATLEQIANLSQVDFFIDRASDGRLAGVPIGRLARYDELSATDILRLAAAIRSDRLPLAFTLHVGASNPQQNGVAASLLELDWRLLMRDRETVRGRFDQTTALPPGQVVDLPVGIELDLRQFFDSDLRDLVDLALDSAGRGGEQPQLRLLARPTINTPIGPIQYPGEITIASR